MIAETVKHAAQRIYDLESAASIAAAKGDDALYKRLQADLAQARTDKERLEFAKRGEEALAAQQLEREHRERNREVVARCRNIAAKVLKSAAAVDEAPRKMAADVHAFRSALKEFYSEAEKLADHEVTNMQGSHAHSCQTLLQSRLRFHRIHEIGLAEGKEPKAIVDFLSPILEGIIARLERDSRSQ